MNQAEPPDGGRTAERKELRKKSTFVRPEGLRRDGPARIFVAATRQNDGKTTTSLGLIHSLQQRFGRVGYIKPVGQRYTELDGHKVDEDALLIRETCDLEGELADMSPIAIPRGFTESYIFSPDPEKLEKEVLEGFSKVAASSDIVVIEGTGHAGVGSVFDMSNADVARLLDSRVLLVASGGIGRPIDEVMLNKALFDSRGVEILGVIINKVEVEKYDKINRAVRKGLERLGLECVGVVPYRKVLSSPTMEQILEDLGGKLLSGKSGLKNTVGRMVIGAMAPHEAMDYFAREVLLITPGTREDLVIAAMSSCVVGIGKTHCVSGIVITGGIEPHKNIMELISRTFIPVISVPEDTFTVASKVNKLIVKVRPGDSEKVRTAEELFEEFVDLDRILEKMA